MATPGTSRSGRVLKKSVKLLEMETDYKPPPARASFSKSPKGPAAINETSIINPSSAIIMNSSVISQSPTQVATSVSTPKITNNLKIKFNLSSDSLKVDKPQKPTTTQIGSVKMNLNPTMVNITSAGKIATPIKIFTSADNKMTINPNTIVLKLKNDGGSDTKILTATPKRFLETATTTQEPVKKIKIDPQPEQAKPAPPIVATPTIIPTNVKPTKLEFPKKIQIVQQAVGKSDPDQPFKAILSPIGAGQVDKDVKPKIQMQSFVTSTPKVNTIIPPKMITKSIQEQKRINLKAKAIAALQNPPTTKPLILTPSRTASATSSSTTRRAAQKDADQTNLPAEDGKEKKKHAVSAYVLWCRESRSEMQSRYPDLDFINLSRKMGEIWHTLAQNEKDIWFKKARMLTQSSVATDELYSQDWISDDLKPKTVSSKQTLPINTETLEMFDENFGNNENVGVVGTEVHPVGTGLIDVHAYLNILGDSLETIGSYLQRGVKYNSDIDYSQSTALSTLLDTALVAMGSLSCLTGTIPKIAPNKEKLTETMENVSYFMPPTNLSYDA